MRMLKVRRKPNSRSLRNFRQPKRRKKKKRQVGTLSLKAKSPRKFKLRNQKMRESHNKKRSLNSSNNRSSSNSPRSRL
jgi:hypothetical protein